MLNKNENMIEVKKTKRRLSLLVIISSAILFSLSSLVLAPIYIYTCSDVLFSVTAIPEILDIVIDIVDVFAYSICFAALIYSTSKFGSGGTVKLIMVFSAACFLRYTANLLITFLGYGSLSTGDAFSVILPFVLDTAIAVSVVLVASSAMKSFYKRTASQGVSSVINASDKKIINLGNPLHVSALYSGAILSFVRIATRIIYDIFIGLPSTLSDAVWMITYYISDLLILVIVYALSLYTFAKLELKKP
ncbi:MAG: hypothetical protein E7641_06010 [Ruminococcaceae bacterium]|nr:hypothetical protein [Oscillospiraceae bacterium]